MDVYLKPAALVKKQTATSSTAQMLEAMDKKLLFLMNKSLDKIISAESPEEEREHRSSFKFFAKHHIKIKEISSGSIVWSLVFTSLDSLKVFWNEYLSGHLKEMFEKDFITKDLLEALELEAAEIQISVIEQNFKTCNEELKGLFVITNSLKL